MLKTGYRQPCLASPLPAGCEAGGLSSVSSIYQEVDSTFVSFGRQPEKTMFTSVQWLKGEFTLFTLHFLG